MTTRYRLFAAATPGLEGILTRELSAILPDVKVDERRGGAAAWVEQPKIWRVAWSSRLAESLRVRIGQPFEATDFAALEAGLSKLPLSAFLPAGATPRVKVTSRRSRLYHTGAISERLLRIVAARPVPGGTPQTTGPDMHVRIIKDRVQISVDASGELLHRRGWRKHVTGAPIRETLAAATLTLAGWEPGRPLWDPFCGAGTIPIEALRWAAGLPAASDRGFAFERWPTHDPEAYAAWKAGWSAPEAVETQVWASDRDPAAIAAAKSNAERAGVEASCELGDFEAVGEAIPAGTAIVSNLPYGKRLKDTDLRELHERFGRFLQRRADLRPVHVLTAYPHVAEHTPGSWERGSWFDNRGTKVGLWRLRG